MIIPEKLKKDDLIRVIAPSRSLGIISKENREITNKRFEEMGLQLSFGEHVEEIDGYLIEKNLNYKDAVLIDDCIDKSGTYEKKRL